MGGFQGSPLLDPADNFQQLRGVDVGNRLATDPGEDAALHSADDPITMASRPLGGVLGVPFPRHYFEAVGCLFDRGSLLCFAVFARIDLVC